MGVEVTVAVVVERPNAGVHEADGDQQGGQRNERRYARHSNRLRKPAQARTLSTTGNGCDEPPPSEQPGSATSRCHVPAAPPVRRAGGPRPGHSHSGRKRRPGRDLRRQRAGAVRRLGDTNVPSGCRGVDLDPLGLGVQQPVFLHAGRRVVAELDAAVARYALRRQDPPLQGPPAPRCGSGARGSGARSGRTKRRARNAVAPSRISNWSANTSAEALALPRTSESISAYTIPTVGRLCALLAGIT